MNNNSNEVLDRAREIVANELFPDEHPGDAHANYVGMAWALIEHAAIVAELERKLAIAVEALERLIDFQIGYRSVFGLFDGPKTEHCVFLNPAKEALAKIKEGEK